jgi:NAD(P)H-dependent FMN reductase
MNEKKITAFAGSTSSKSINRKLVAFTLTYFQGYEVEFLDLNEFEMPIFSVDRQTENGIPEKANTFRRYMAQCDAIICSLAEHNRSYTTAFKNIFDWSSRVDLNIFANKPMLLMSTSPGGFGGGNVMNAAKSFFPKCGANIIETFSLPSFHQNFINETIADEVLKVMHLEKVQNLKKYIEQTDQ